MKTIEERAKEYAPGISNSDSLFPTRISTLAAIERRGYVAGATDQKAIDIDKACEWLGVHLAEVADRYDSTLGLHLRFLRENFRKAMEKEL